MLTESAAFTIEDAIVFAAQKHKGQVDKGGQPYILHPLRVMAAVTTEHERMAAVLHDVVEDTPATFENLTDIGVPAPVVEAIRLLSKSDGEKRVVAARRAEQNEVARNVKLADVRDNMNLDRIPNLTEKAFKRLEEYKEVEAILLGSGARLAGNDGRSR